LFRRERQVEARKIVLQLRKLSCPDNGDNRHRAVAEPCQRDFRHAAAGLAELYRLRSWPFEKSLSRIIPARSMLMTQTDSRDVENRLLRAKCWYNERSPLKAKYYAAYRY
jgi:hypothetical protein